MNVIGSIIFVCISLFSMLPMRSVMMLQNITYIFLALVIAQEHTDGKGCGYSEVAIKEAHLDSGVKILIFFFDVLQFLWLGK